MQQIMFFMSLMILMVIINAVIISAKMPDDDEVMKKLYKEIRKKCIKSSNLTKEEAKLIYDYKLFSKDTIVAQAAKPLQCYCLCYLQELGIFVNNKPNEQFLRQNLPLLINDQKKTDNVLNNCMKLEGDDKCAMGYNFELCLAKEVDFHIY